MPVCKNNVTKYHEFDNSKNIFYHEWVFEKQGYKGKDGEEKMKRITLKKKKEDTPRNVIDMFETLLIVFKHSLNITMQYSTVKELKENLSDNEVLIHVDFNENYLLKYNEEIQNFHFGGSRQQISLHTGVLYYRDSQTKEITCKSFCTVSENIRHDALTIWAHLEPVLNMVQKSLPNLDAIHFLSDSPSSQYRNRFIFYMLTKLKEQIHCLNLVTWNYQESGHGKGAPDGIGAVVKRTADNHVRLGGDVATFEDFVQVVQKNIKNIELIIIPEESISRKIFPKNIPSFKGTTKIHQAVWSSPLPFDVVLRSLSCFACRNSYVPCKHGRHLGVLNVGLCQNITAQSTSYNSNNVLITSKDSLIDACKLCKSPRNSYNYDDIVMTPMDAIFEQSTPNNKNNDLVTHSINSLITKSDETVHDVYDNDSLIHIDTPTIYNNIGDLMQYGYTTEASNLDTNIENSSKIKILSNIPVNCQCLTDNHSSQGFSAVDQTEFIKFLQRPDLQDFETVIEKSKIKLDLSNDWGKTNNMTDKNFENDKENEDEIDDLKYNVDDWVVVEYKTNKNPQYFVGKIIEKFRNTLEYKIIFLRKAQGRSLKFGWPMISDDDIISQSCIFLRLEEPVESRRGQFVFKNLPELRFQ
ncbi:hypothetical protein ACJJTC_002524 [Scirpophaga incertulas]